MSLFLLGLSPLPGDEAEGEEEAAEGRRQAEEDREGHDAQDDDEKNAEIDWRWDIKRGSCGYHWLIKELNFGSPGQVVMGGDSCSKGRGFESQHCILDGHF